jgi:hypothetical protein
VGITDRAAECWEPLLAVADLAGGGWPERARAAAVHFVTGAKDETASPGVELLEHIQDAFAGAEAMWTEALLAHLHERSESPWKDIKGKPLDDRGLARRLKGFGIRSRDIKLNGHVRKGYRAEQFHDAWKRYLALSATNATSATKLINQNNSVAEVAEVAARTCKHCGGFGTLLEASYNGEPVLLHRDCIKPFLALEIPPMLRRALP